MTNQKERIRNAAKIMLEEGYSVIPVKPNKRSYGSWKQYQSERMDISDVDQKFNGATNFAVIGGKVSKGLEILDIDDAECRDSLIAMIEAKHPDLEGRLVYTKTPNGYGIAYRCMTPVPGNLKLAMTWEEVDKEGEFEWNGRTTLKSKKVGDKWVVSACRLETRGEAGYALVHPSPGYKVLKGSFIDLRPISKEDRDSIIAIARTFDQTPKSQTPDIPKEKEIKNNLPKIKRIGDVFNEESNFEGLLLDAGWKKCGKTDKGTTFTRPGKESGVSGQLHNDGYFYVYSSNCPPLKEETQYSPLKFVCDMEYEGNYSACVKKMVEVGYEVKMTYGEVKYVLEHNPDEVDNAFNNSGLDEDSIVKILLELGLDVPDGRTIGRRIIEYISHQPNRVVKELDSALAEVPGRWGVYTYMDRVGYISEHQVTGNLGITERFKGFKAYDVDSLELRIEQSASFVKEVGKGDNKHWNDCRCPTHIIKKYMVNPELSAKPIKGFSSHPTVDIKTGEIYGLEYGYDREMFFTHHGGFTVSDLDFKECYQRVVDIMCKDILFKPDVKELMESVFVSTMMTGLIRPGLAGGCPGTLVLANEPGTGKSYVIKLMATVVMGGNVSSMPWRDHQEERTKLLTSTLMKGKEVILYDNLPQGATIDDGVLAELLTSGTYMDRILGKSEMTDVAGNVLLLMGGNAINLTAEMSRRMCVIKLEADSATPAKRKVSDPDILNTVGDKRKEIISYLLRMIQLGVDMEKKIETNSGCGTFWDTVVRNPLMLELGIDIMDAFGSESGESEEMDVKDLAIGLLGDLCEQENWEDFSSRQLFNHVNGATSGGEETDLLETEVKDVMSQINGYSWKSIKSLGKSLKTLVNRVSGEGMRLRCHKTSDRPLKWWVENV